MGIRGKQKPLQKCRSNGKGVCFACTSKGKCTALDNTYFCDHEGKQRECPFKKSPDQLKREIEKMKERFELVYNEEYTY